MHDDAAYVPPRACTSAGPRRTRCAASRPGCASTPGSATTSSPRSSAAVEDAIAEAVARAEASAWPDPGHARRWRLRRLRQEPSQKPLSLPRYRPWFYDIVRGLERRVPAHACSGMTARRGRERAGGGRRRARADAPLVRRHARGRRAAQAAALPRDGQVRALPRAAARPRDRARRRLPGERAVQDMEAYETAVRLLREGEMLLVFPEGTRNRDGNARPQLGAARLAIEAGAASCRSRSRGSDGIQLLPPRLPEDPRLLRGADPARRPAGR